MKLIFEEYAQAVIAALVAVAIIMTLGAVFLSKEKPLFDSMQEKYENECLVWKNAHGAFKEQKQKARTDVYLLTGRDLLAGQRYQVASLLGTKEPNQLESICVEECFQENFIAKPIQKYEGGKVFSIESSGVYWLKINAIDQSGITYKNWIKVFVNGGVA